jgi:hypothetical protein
MKLKTECPDTAVEIRESQKFNQTNGSDKDLGNPRQYNFSRHWRKRIVPLLEHRGVLRVLTLGLKLHDIGYDQGDPPWLCGRGQWNGQRVKKGCLSWYQPWGRCHHIAPFCWALGKHLFPDLKWGFLSGELHTVVIGWSDDREQPDWVMDILLFREKTAQESLAFVKQGKWTYYDSLGRYASSFFAEPEDALAAFAKQIDDGESTSSSSGDH